MAQKDNINPQRGHVAVTRLYLSSTCSQASGEEERLDGLRVQMLTFTQHVCTGRPPPPGAAGGGGVGTCPILVTSPGVGVSRVLAAENQVPTQEDELLHRPRSPKVAPVTNFPPGGTVIVWAIEPDSPAPNPSSTHTDSGLVAAQAAPL